LSALNYAISVVSQKIIVEAPEQAPEHFKMILNSCFNFKPSLRPSAEEISKQLQQY